MRANRGKAFTIGYAAVLVVSAILFAVSLFYPVSGADAAHAILIVGVVAPIYAFSVLERVNA